MNDKTLNTSPDFDGDDFTLDSRTGYDVMFNLYMTEPGAKESDFPTYEEYLASIKDKTLPDKLGFVMNPGVTATSAAGAFAGKFATDVLSGMSGKLNADAFLDSAQKVAREKVKEFATRTAQGMADQANEFFSNTDEGDGGTSKANYSGGSAWNPTGISTNLKPMDTQFNTEVAFTGIPKYYLDGQDQNGPLIMKFGTPGLLDSTNAYGDSQIWDFFRSAISTEWRREISKRVVVNDRVETNFTDEAIINLFNTYLQALSIYYFWQSVIAYTNESRNRNEGMHILRKALTPDEYNALYTLRRAIDNAVIPPFLHKFVHYMMGNYKQSHLPGSPLLKIMPFSFRNTGGGVDPIFDQIAEIAYEGGNYRPIQYGIILLETPSIKGAQDIMARAFPDWCNAEVMDYTPTPRFDPDYLTFWVNAYYVGTHDVGGNNTIAALPYVNDVKDEFCYNLHTDAPDGWIQAMQTVNVATQSIGVPGLFRNWGWFTNGQPLPNVPGGLGTVVTTYYKNSQVATTSCVIYDRSNPSALRGFHPIELAQYWQSLAANTFNVFYSSSALHSFQKFGTERIINMDILNIRQANYEFVNLMYTNDLRALPLPGKIQQGGKVYSATNKKRSKYGKRSSKADKNQDDT